MCCAPCHTQIFHQSNTTKPSHTHTLLLYSAPASRAQQTQSSHPNIESVFLCSEVTNPGYDFSNPGFDMGTGDFTQVVWKSTSQVGVAISSNGNYLICNYLPAGNVQGAFPTNVLRLTSKPAAVPASSPNAAARHAATKLLTSPKGGVRAAAEWREANNSNTKPEASAEVPQNGGSFGDDNPIRLSGSERYARDQVRQPAAELCVEPVSMCFSQCPPHSVSLCFAPLTHCVAPSLCLPHSVPLTVFLSLRQES